MKGELVTPFINEAPNTIIDSPTGTYTDIPGELAVNIPNLSASLVETRRFRRPRVIFASATIALSEFLAACSATSPKNGIGEATPTIPAAIGQVDMDTTSGFAKATPQEISRRANSITSQYLGKRLEAEDKLNAPANCVDVIWAAMDAYGIDRGVLRQATAIDILNVAKTNPAAKEKFDYLAPGSTFDDGDFIFLKAPPYGKYVDTTDRKTKFAGHTGIATGATKGEFIEIIDQNYDPASPIRSDWVPANDVAGALRAKVLGTPIQSTYEFLPLDGPAPTPTLPAVGNVTGPGTTEIPVTQPPGEGDFKSKLDKIFSEILPSNEAQILKDWFSYLNTTQIVPEGLTDGSIGTYANFLRTEIENPNDITSDFLKNILDGGVSEVPIRVSMLMVNSSSVSGQPDKMNIEKTTEEIEISKISSAQVTPGYGIANAVGFKYSIRAHGVVESVNGTVNKDVGTAWINVVTSHAMFGWSDVHEGAGVFGDIKNGLVIFNDGFGEYSENTNNSRPHTIMAPFAMKESQNSRYLPGTQDHKEGFGYFNVDPADIAPQKNVDSSNGFSEVTSNGFSVQIPSNWGHYKVSRGVDLDEFDDPGNKERKTSGTGQVLFDAHVNDMNILNFSQSNPPAHDYTNPHGVVIRIVQFEDKDEKTGETYVIRGGFSQAGDMMMELAYLSSKDDPNADKNFKTFIDSVKSTH